MSALVGVYYRIFFNCRASSYTNLPIISSDNVPMPNITTFFQNNIPDDSCRVAYIAFLTNGRLMLSIFINSHFSPISFLLETSYISSKRLGCMAHNKNRTQIQSAFSSFMAASNSLKNLSFSFQS